jgi:hypothetical protein
MLLYLNVFLPNSNRKLCTVMATTVTVPAPAASIELRTLSAKTPSIHTSASSPARQSLSAADEESSPTDDQPPEGATVFGRPDVLTMKGKLISANFAIFVAGMNDSSTGALIPYLQPAYDIGLLFVALVYLINFSGWLVAAFTNVHLTARLGMGGVLVFGAVVQMLAYCLMFWVSPCPFVDGMRFS